jgi:ribonuclease BN (tRNA processing enzyme)
VKLTVVGCSPAWPNPGGAHSGYLVEGPGAVLLDCGPGVLGRLRRDSDGSGGWPEVDAIAITHFHLDHCGDLVPWVWGSMYRGDARARPELWLPPDGERRLEEVGAALGFRGMFGDVFELREYAAGQPFDSAGLSVTATPVPHYGLDAYGFRVTDGARTLAYSGDSAPGEGLQALAHEADLFVCEATLERGELDGEPRGHLSLAEAEAAFEASGARELLLTHRPAELPAPARHALAHDGLVLEL